MGGIIAALIGIALIIGGFIWRARMRKAAATLQAKADKAAAQLDTEKNSYNREILNQQERNNEREASAARLLSRTGYVGVIAGLIIFALTVISQVPTRNIGVTTAFGKTTGTLGNGLHLTAPWESVTIYDATIQTLMMSGTDPETPTLWVRIANGAMAQMEVSVDWQVDPKADIQQLHLDWRNFDQLQERVIKPRLSDSMNKSFENYDPLVAFKASGGQPISLSVMEGQVRERLQASVPAGILIKRLAIPLPIFPAQVQEALNNMQKELAATQIAIQQKLTAEQQRLAIEELQKAKMTPEAFLQQCLIVTERLAQQGKKISEAWSCTGTSMPITVAAGK